MTDEVEEINSGILSLVCNDVGTGYYQGGYRYDWNPTPMNWYDGRAYCQQRGGDLAYHGMDSLTTRE